MDKGGVKDIDGQLVLPGDTVIFCYSYSNKLSKMTINRIFPSGDIGVTERKSWTPKYGPDKGKVKNYNSNSIIKGDFYRIEKGENHES